MDIANTIQKMIEFSNGNLHDINHFLKVYTYAKTIGELEQLSKKEQFTLELASILHDVACPMCREKYGNTNGKMQEKEGEPLARKILLELNFEKDIIDRVCYLVAHHHTYTNVDRKDYQILLEADYIVNADENNYSLESIICAKEKIFKTKVGLELLQSIYQLSSK